MDDPITTRYLERARRDLISLDNTARGAYAEELVASALPGATTRVGWADYDIDWDGMRIEVKTSGLVQFWHRPEQAPGPPRWSVGARRGWDPTSNVMSDIASRASDAYVFCLHEGRDIAAGWSFYVVATAALDELNQSTLGLATLRMIGGEVVGLEDLAQGVRDACGLE